MTLYIVRANYARYTQTRKKNKMRKVILRYAINRSWGDGHCGAMYNAVRGKSFQYLLTPQIITSAGENMLSADESAEILKQIMGEK